MKKQRLIPELILSLHKGYTLQKFSKDCIAGLIVGIIALPLSIALSIAAGAGPEAGLLTAIFAGGTAAILGGCKTQIDGPTGAFVIVIFGILASHGMSGLFLATLMSGIIMIIMGLLRLGKLVRYIPLPVVTGFTVGVAITIFLGQLKDFFGLSFLNVPADNINKIIFLVNNISKLSWISFGMGAAAIIIIIVLPKLQKVVPGALGAIFICTVINLFLPTKSVTLGDIFGNVEIVLIPSFSFIDLNSIIRLLGPAITIAILASMETLLTAVVADGMTGHRHNPNMELIGLGMGNVVAPIFGGIPASGAITRTSANIKSGGSSPVSGVVHSIVILVLSLFLMPFAKYIPMTVFAAILIVVCYNMISIREIKSVLKTNPFDILLMVLTLILSVVFGLLISILASTFLSVVYQLYKKYIKKDTASNILTFECNKLKGHICFMNYEKLIDIGNNENMVLDMSEVEGIDATFTEFLITKAQRKQIRISAVNKKILRKLLKHEEFASLDKEI